MSYVNPDALVSTEWLADHLGDPQIAVIDASWHLPAAERNGGEEYEAAHIPGSVFFDVDSIADTGSGLPHTIPSPEFFAGQVGALGIDNSKRVIAYDSNGGFMAAMRAWWMFRLYGHDRVAVLDGGLPKWLAEDRPMTDAATEIAAADFEARFRAGMVRTLDQIMANIEDAEAQVVDVRAPGRFDGTEPEPRPGMRSGHIPGSVNLPFAAFLDKDRHFVMRSADEIGAVIGGTGGTQNPIVASCGSGVTACVAALALHLIGRDDVAVYDGSWSEWGGRDDTPVET